MVELSHKDLLVYLSYDPCSGVFIWKKTINSRAIKGRRAGRLWNKQYRRISINGVEYQEHRLAWFYVKGHWPKYEIDHINRDKSDNRIENLRDVVRSVNQQNKGITKANTSGVPGVSWLKREEKWSARISVHGERIWLGRFHDIKDAEIAYKTAKSIFHL